MERYDSRAVQTFDFLEQIPDTDPADTARLIAEQQRLPWVSTVLAPLNLFSSLDPPLYPAGGWLQAVRALGVTSHRLVFNLLKRMIRHWEAPLRTFRAELGLPRLARFLARVEAR